MRFVSLFAGVGGFDLGLERAGHECIAQVEIDKHCRTVLDKHWPDVPKHDDVRTAIEFADTFGLVGRTDLVCGGFPCQDVSVAGKRAGLAGEHTGLFWDALAFTTHVQARWLLLENVPGLLTSNQGRDFGTILLALDDAGFHHLEWRVLDSQFFGVPQRRRRVFLVASTSIPHRRPLLVEREGREWDPAPLRTAWKDAAGTVEGSIGFSHNQGLDIQPSTRVFPTLRSGGGGQAVVDFRHGTVNAVSPTLQAKGTGGVSLNYLPGVLEVSDGSVDEVTQGHEPRGLRDMDQGGVSPTLNAFDQGDSRATVLIGPVYSFKPGQSEAAGGPFITEGVVPTLQAQNNGSTAVPAISAGPVVRRLTPVECERLQGFPDNWTAGLADTHRYKQMGNAVTVNVAHYIGWLLADA